MFVFEISLIFRENDFFTILAWFDEIFEQNVSQIANTSYSVKIVNFGFTIFIENSVKTEHESNILQIDFTRYFFNWILLFFPHCVSALFLYGKIVGEHKRIFVLLRVIKLSHSFSVPKPSSQITPFLQSCCFEAEFLLNHLGSFANSYFFCWKPPFILTVWWKNVIWLQSKVVKKAINDFPAWMKSFTIQYGKTTLF